jgi:nucleoside-diphosphate-sugar epimerase
MVFGRSGSILAPAFRTAALEKKISWPGGPKARFSAVHTDDLADLYVRASERAHLVKGLAITGTAETGSVDDFLARLGEIIGFQGEVEFYAPRNRMSFLQSFYSH